MKGLKQSISLALMMCIPGYAAERKSFDRSSMDRLLQLVKSDRETMSTSRTILAALVADNISLAKTLITENNLRSSEDLIKFFEHARSRKQYDFLAWLIRNTQIASLKGDDNKTLLILMAGIGDVVRTKLLIDAKADLNAQTEHGGWTALMEASDKGHLEVVKALLKAGANVKIEDYEGRTALWWAESCNRQSVAQVLRNYMNGSRRL
jgi:ankyrin repeat protein